MRIRQTVKKAVALGTGALMLGATILGASAANVSDYPTAFVKDGKVVAKIVVGEKAQAIDIVGAIDIAADLQANAVSKTTVSTTGTGVSVSGGKTEKVGLTQTLSAAFGTMDNGDLPSLKDERITWNEEELDVEEKLTVTGVKVMTSETDEDFGATPVLGTNASNAIEYSYIINDADFNASKVDAVDNKLSVEILGKSMEITGITSNSIDVNVATETYMVIGDTVTVEGKKVKVVNIGSGSFVVDVDGVVESVAAGATGKKVNGIRVQADSSDVFYVDEKADRAITLSVGDKITDTITDGESMELFGEPAEENDAEWVWDISSPTSTQLTIKAQFNQKYDTDTEAVRKIGEKYTLPNEYASIYIDSLTEKTDKPITFKFIENMDVDKWENGTTVPSGTSGYEDINALKISAEENLFKVVVGAETKDAKNVYVLPMGSGSVLGYDNKDGDLQLFTNGSTMEPFTITEDADNTITFRYDNASKTDLNLTISGLTIASSELLVLDGNLVNKSFGPKADDFESGDYTVTSGFANLGKDNDYLTNYGVIISAIENMMDNDEFQITIPSDKVEANVVILGATGAAASAASGSVTTDKVNPVGVDFAVLDKDFTAGSTNSIVVGGPCVNTFAAKLMGNPTNCAEGFSEGEAKLAAFADGSKVALIVAGYSGADTLKATKALVTQDLPATQSATLVTTSEPKFK